MKWSCTNGSVGSSRCVWRQASQGGWMSSSVTIPVKLLPLLLWHWYFTVYHWLQAHSQKEGRKGGGAGWRVWSNPLNLRAYQYHVSTAHTQYAWHTAVRHGREQRKASVMLWTESSASAVQSMEVAMRALADGKGWLKNFYALCANSWLLHNLCEKTLCASRQDQTPSVQGWLWACTASQIHHMYNSLQPQPFMGWGGGEPGADIL